MDLATVFHFRVDWGAATFAFSEVTGINEERQVIEYRAGTDPEYIAKKYPGMRKSGNITLKRGVTAGNNEFYEWYNATKLNKPERRDIIISLLNEDHEPLMTWKVKEAFITKITSPDLKASGNEIGIETIEVAHNGFTIEAA